VVVPARALTPATLGAWLVKAAGAAPSTRTHARAGFATVATWCVRPSYRTALVAPGQAVLLWVSGTEAELPAGIHARGRTTGPAEDGVMPVVLEPLTDPLPRSELLAHPGLAALEVLRMPAGSNPSFVTPAQLEVLVEMRPELALPV
jgi:hypothetical protein